MGDCVGRQMVHVPIFSRSPGRASQIGQECVASLFCSVNKDLRMRTRNRLFLVGLTVVLLGSCGGGGGGSSPSANNPAGSGSSGGTTTSSSQTSSSTTGNATDSNEALPSLPASIEQDYLTYESQLLDVEAHYGDKPLAISTSALWYKSLSYPSSAVVSKEAREFTADEAMEHGVGYGTFFNIDASKTLIFYTFWAPQKPASGGVYVLEMVDGVAQSLTATKIPGGTRVHVLGNADGTKTIVLPGVDEGELVLGEPGDAPSYVYDLASNSWSDANILSGAHGSIVFDFEKDGDDDVFVQSWGGEFDGSAMVFKNDAGSLSPLKIPHQDVPGLNALAPFYDESNRLGIVFTDAVNVGEQWGIPNERSVIAYFPSDLSARAEQVDELPIPYFERADYEGIPQVIPDWDGNVGLSHDVSAKVIDLDLDGDLDIVIGSMIWSDEYPYGVLQLLINNDGVFTDETDERLVNWVLAGNAPHQLDFIDLNDDGFIDILVSDHGNMFHKIPSLQDNSLGGGSRVLINDGTGHFVVVAHHLIHQNKAFGTTFVPSISAFDEKLRFTRMDTFASSQPSRSIYVEEVEFDYAYSTGPNGRDPAAWGEPDFNEFFYLLHNQSARDAVTAGTYETGLEHYIEEGKSAGLKSHANE